MSRRAILVGFEPGFAGALAATGIEPAARIASAPPQPGEPGEFIAARDYVRYRLPAEPGPPIAEDLRRAARELCFDAFIRCAGRYANSSALINDTGDYDLLFDRALCQARDILARLKANMVLFSNVPHRCATLALFACARASGLDAAICLQTPFANRVWIVDDWRDLGTFTSSRVGDPIDIDIAPPAQMPFYMDRIESPAAKTRRAALRYAEFNLRFLLTPFSLARRDGQQRLNRVLDELRGAGQMLRHAGRRRRAGEIALADLPERFVYFPLHLQPEMTTDVLGGPWSNQILALLRLRQLVPEDIAIIVKENPKQTGLMRSPLFWERLAAIPNLSLVEDRASSLELVRRAALTATVTGTAGWEALRCGKPALAFGQAFWRGLPGAFDIAQNNPTWQTIEAFHFDEKKLSKAVEAMGRRSYAGVSDPYYARLVEGFSPQANNALLAASLNEHLQAGASR